MKSIRSGLAFYGFDIGDRNSMANPEEPVPDSRDIDDPPMLGPPGANFPEPDLYSLTEATVPRLRAHGGAAGPYVLRAGSVAGRNHLAAKQTCEDAFEIRFIEELGLAIVVADGLGDPRAQFSGIGAASAVRAIAEQIEETSRASPTLTPPTDFSRAAEAMMTRSERRLGHKVSSNEIATTVIAATLDLRGNFEALCVGDCGYLILGPSGWRSTHARNHVANDPGGVLPAGWESAKRQHDRLGPGEMLVVGTDGLIDALQISDTARYFASRWRQPPTFERFVADLSFVRRGENDDRTGVCVWFV